MAGYIGTQPVPQATQTRDSFTATAGQTSFATSGYAPGFLDVYLNGIKLAAADYTASNGSDVVLASGAALDDILEVVAYTTFEAANVTGADDFTVTGSFTSRGIDDNATSTAMTLDSSGNLLVGTTDPLPNVNNVEGVAISSGSYGGFLAVSRDNDTPMGINRKTSDGALLDFRKDGSTVGSIGSNTGDKIYIGTGASGVGFSTLGLLPFNPSASTFSNNSLDLGANGLAWKDLYLSGGVYLGGTGSANKLDDYEEGTWTPVFDAGSSITATYTSAAGNYVKVGNLVLASFDVNANITSAIGGGKVSVPFAASSSGAYYTSPVFRSASALGTITTGDYRAGYVDNNFIYLQEVSTNGVEFNVGFTTGSNLRLNGWIMYYTS